ncbi:phenylacetate--CoA ligase family protein [Candidatus Nitrospira bockiana]
MTLYTFARSLNWSRHRYPAASCKAVLEESQYWRRDRLDEYQNAKLQRLIRHCYETVPYYGRVMRSIECRPEEIASTTDLGKLPVLTRDIIRRHGEELLSRYVSRMSVSWAQTGGTTGEPIRVCRNTDATAWASMCHERGLAWGGLEPDEPRIRLVGGSLGIGRTKIAQRLGAAIRGDVFLPAFELDSRTCRAYFEAIRTSKARVLLGYSSAIYRLACLARQTSQCVDLRVAFRTAETLDDEKEQLIRDTFGCAVLPYYGCGEVNALGYYPWGSPSYVIPEEHVVMEVLRHDGSTGLTGEGRFLITDLDNYAMPILRYQNGDAGEIAPHDGGMPYKRIVRLDGRYNSLLMTDRGELISGAIGPHIFRNVTTVEKYQIIQEEPLRIVIKVVPKGRVSEADRSLVVGILQRHLGERMQVTMEEVLEIPSPPSGKSVFVINRCLQ